MEANRRMGPNVSGAIGNLAPLFAVVFAVIVLGEVLYPAQAVGVAAVVGGVMLLSLERSGPRTRWPLWALWLPAAGAVVRGAAPPAVKLGLALWPDPFAATLIGYTVSAVLLVGAALIRSGGRLPRVGARGTGWFVLVGLGNGLSVLLIYLALARGPVTLVAPLFATHPLVTLVVSRVLLRGEPIGLRLALGIAGTVAGVALLILGQPR